MAAGFDTDRFWNLTPKETAIYFAGAKRREDQAERYRRWHTWHAAVLLKARRFPTLAEFNPPEAARPSAVRLQPQSGEEQMAVLQALFAARAKR